MADTAFAYPADMRPPRHFWRRAFAFFVDFLAFYLVLGVISIPVYFLTGWNMGVLRSETTTCDVAPPSALTRKVEAEWPLSNNETRTNQICLTTGFMIPDQRIFVSTVTKTDDGGTSNRSASIGIDENGNEIGLDQTVSMSWLVIATSAFGSLVMGILFIIASAKITATGRRTPGKALLSLRILDRTSATPSFGRCLKRETFKLFPAGILDAIVSALLFKSLWDMLAPAGGDFSGIIRVVRDSDLSNFGTVLAVQLIGSIAMFIWWFGPFIVWRGQTFYDRIAGCFVVRFGAANPATPT